MSNTFGIFDTPVVLALDEALLKMGDVMSEQGFRMPTAIVVGEDVKEQLRAGGLSPYGDGTWITIRGVEIR